MHEKLLDNVAMFLSTFATNEANYIPVSEWVYNGLNRRQGVFLRRSWRWFDTPQLSAYFATLELANIGNHDEHEGKPGMFLSVLRLLEQHTRYVTYVENVQVPDLKPIMPRLGYTMQPSRDAQWDTDSPSFFKINGPMKTLIKYDC